ncbi:hypothetical protein RBB50_000113 [Rhinocladiella similis]
MICRADANKQRHLTVQSLDDIIVCSRMCSEALIAFGSQHTSWIHFAVFQPKLEEEHANFWNSQHNNGNLSRQEFSWLAIYFSYTCATLSLMDENLASDIDLPIDDTNRLVENWYHAALYCLYQADYVRIPDIRNVQAIAILNIVFTNLGDGCAYPIIWATAIRIAQALRLDEDEEHLSETLAEQQLRRRLWWTLVICEWLPLPYRKPCIAEADFNVAFPSYLDDEDILAGSAKGIRSAAYPRPVGYHLALCRIAVIYYRFRSMIGLGAWTTTELLGLIRDADNELALVISNVPPHLRPDERQTEATQSRNMQHPWIRSQLQHLIRVLFYRRITINRILQSAWHSQPTVFDGPRAVCLLSARTLIYSIKRPILTVASQRSAPFNAALFSAAVPLIFEAKNCNEGLAREYLEDVDCAMELLARAAPFSSLAREAIRTLQKLMND